jgi:hypothetical protein
MLAYMDWLMIPFAVFYLMLAAFAVVVWVQLRREDMAASAIKPPPRRSSRSPGAVAARPQYGSAPHDARPRQQPNRRIAD